LASALSLYLTHTHTLRAHAYILQELFEAAVAGARISRNGGGAGKVGTEPTLQNAITPWYVFVCMRKFVCLCWRCVSMPARLRAVSIL
jgi:hypothetical protein